MTTAHRRSLLENTSFEWKNIYLQPLLFQLKARRVLTQDECNKLEVMNGEPHKQKAYLLYLLPRKPDSAFDVLVSLLEAKQCKGLCAKIKENRKFDIMKFYNSF